MIRAILFSELLKELSKGQVDPFGPFGKVRESVVRLALGVDDFVPCLFDHVGLVLPKVVGLLGLAVAAENAWPVGLYIVVVKAFCRHGGVVTLWHIADRGYAIVVALGCQEPMKIIVPKFRAYPLAKGALGGGSLLVEPGSSC